MITRVLGEFCSGDLGKAKRLLEKAVLLVTLNDDPETLEGILKWAEGWKAKECVDFEKDCPVLFACCYEPCACNKKLVRCFFPLSGRDSFTLCFSAMVDDPAP